jgi:Na+-transporting NADH:ubiquinone oxidoreductase subunit NqrF
MIILIIDGPRGQTTAQSVDPTGLSAAIICDVPVSDSIDTILDKDFHSFSVIAGEIVSITVEEVPSGQDFSPFWRLIDKIGQSAVSCGSSSTVDHRDCGPLPANGSPYSIEIQDYNNDNTGTYKVHIQRLTSSAACEGTALSCDTPAPGNIEDDFDTDLYNFSATEGEIVSIIVDKDPVSQDLAINWRLLDTTGAPAPSCGSDTSSDHRDCGPLPASGSPYTIEVHDYGHNDTGTYQLHIQRLTSSAACEGTALSCDTPAADNIEDEFDTDLFTFSVTEGEIVSIIIDKDPDYQDITTYWRMLDSAGEPAVSCGTSSSSDHRDCGPLPASENPFTIEVQDYGNDNTGTYKLHLQRLTSSAACEGTALSCDTPAAGNIEDAFDTDLFNFNVTEGEIVSIIIDKDPDYQDITTYWRMLNWAGEPAVSCGTSSSSDHRDCGPLPASGNPFTIEVQDYGNDNSGTYKLHIQRLTSSAACEGTNLSCDTPAADNIEDEFDTDLFTFSVTEGEIVSIIIDKDPDYQNISTYWRLLDSAGEPADSCGTSSSSDHRDCGPLPASGNPFTIEVQDYSNDNTGTYKLHLQRLTYSAACEGTALSCEPPRLAILKMLSTPIFSTSTSLKAKSFLSSSIKTQIIRTSRPTGGC